MLLVVRPKQVDAEQDLARLELGRLVVRRSAVSVQIVFANLEVDAGSLFGLRAPELPLRRQESAIGGVVEAEARRRRWWTPPRRTP